VTAILLAAVPIVLIVASYSSDSFRICDNQLTESGEVEEVCGPIDDVDLPVIALWTLVIVLILAPDLTELSIPGLLSIKRDIKDLDEKTDQIQRSLTTLIATNQITQSFHIDVATATPDQARHIVAEAEEKVGQLDEPSPTDILRDVTPERALKEVQILWIWSQLVSLLERYDTPLASRKRRDLPEPNGGILRGWLRDSQHLLYDLRTIRNTVAHTPQNLDDQTVDSALNSMRAVYLSLLQHAESI
jgi:hypothetical protein